MKFKILKSDLYKHISIAQKAISNKSSIQILENIKFQTKDEYLILTTTDLELSIETKVKCEVLREGEALIKSSIIGNIINKMPQDIITITYEGESVNIKSQNSEFNINAQTTEEFPPLPDISEDVTLSLDNKQISQIVKETSFATSLDETRLPLTGILFEIKNDSLRFVGLDGYRMAVRTIENTTDIESSNIVPKRAFIELAKIIDGNSTDIIVVDGHIAFINEGTKMYSRLIEKKYLDYHKIINNTYTTKAIVNRNDLINSLERAQLLSIGGNPALAKFEFEDDKIRIKSNSDFGSLNELIFAEIEGNDLEIAFNTKYLLDGLKAIEDDKVILQLNTSVSPINIYPLNEDNDYLYLVLPVRLSK